MTSKTLALMLFAGLMAAITSAGSALFTSSTTVAANSFTTGTVIISTNPSSALVTFANMAPGDQVTAPITVTNGGSLQMRYAITSLADNTDIKGLRSQLVLTIKSGVTTCTNAGFGSSGVQLYSGVLGNSPAMNVVGDPTTGAQTGDRTLNAGAGETLCFSSSLPGGTGNAFQNATTTATFTFAAEQTANNP